jgi:ABC-type spermidine/putrescine transport system permease subunit I
MVRVFAVGFSKSRFDPNISFIQGSSDHPTNAMMTITRDLKTTYIDPNIMDEIVISVDPLIFEVIPSSLIPATLVCLCCLMISFLVTPYLVKLSS